VGRKEIFENNIEEIIRIGEKHGATNIKLFGSVARGDFDQDSDFDFLYTRKKPTSPWFPGGLKVELEELLRSKVDVVSEKALKPRLKDKILLEAIPLCDLIKKD